MKRKRLEVRALPGALLLALTAGATEAVARQAREVAGEPEGDVQPCLDIMPCLNVVEAPERTTLEEARHLTAQLDSISEEEGQAIREQTMHEILQTYRRLYAEEGASAAADLREGFAVFEAYAETFRRAHGDDAPIRPDIVEAAAELLADINKAEGPEGDNTSEPDPGGSTADEVRPPCLTPLPAQRGCKRDRSTAALLVLLPLAVRRRKLLAEIEHRLPPDVVERLKKG